jgi:hypothetical protein
VAVSGRLDWHSPAQQHHPFHAGLVLSYQKSVPLVITGGFSFIYSSVITSNNAWSPSWLPKKLEDLG